jgi:hypothetical protein
MALVEANNRDQSSVLNTGFDVSATPSLTYMQLFLDKNFTFTQSDIDTAGGFYNYVDQQRHASGIGKFFPIGGNYCKPFNINDNNGSDVTETSNVTGEVIVLRNGTLTRTFQYKDGGLVFAKALISLANAGNLAFIDIDKNGQIIMKDNNGVYSGIPTTVNPLSPALASPTAVFKNQLSMTYDPIDYVNGCNMFKQKDESGNILDIKGLVDVHIDSAAAATTSTATVDIKTKSNADLGTTYGADIVADMLQLNILTGTAPNYTRTPLTFTLSYTGGHYVLNFNGSQQASGTKLEVDGAAASVWYTNDVVGYEVVTPAIITIP